MPNAPIRRGTAKVALLAEGVDRNPGGEGQGRRKCVALLAEGVDRNAKSAKDGKLYIVALLTEGVDRNAAGSALETCYLESPSSRRAWIEIPCPS